MEAGKLDFILHGRRLKGRFALFHLKGRPRQWLLVKQHDQESLPGHDIAKDAQTSILTGRTIEDLQREAATGRLKAYKGKSESLKVRWSESRIFEGTRDLSRPRL